MVYVAILLLGVALAGGYAIANSMANEHADRNRRNRRIFRNVPRPTLEQVIGR